MLGIAVQLLCISSVGAAVQSNAPNGAGTGQIWLDNLMCIGNEARLFECPANSVGSNNCVHSEDLSAICTTSKCIIAMEMCTKLELEAEVTSRNDMVQ